MESTRVRAITTWIPAILIAGIVTLTSCNPDDDVLITKGSWKAFTTVDGLPSDFITALHEDSKGGIWVGTLNGAALYDGKNFEIFDQNDGLLDDNINAIATDLSGNVWIGTNKGLNIRYEGVWYYYEALLDVSCKTIAVDKSGIVWVGTWGAGVIKFTSIQSFTQIFDGLCGNCNFVSSIHADATSRIWAATFGGQVKLLAPNPQSFSTGLPGVALSAVGSDKWGNVWVGSEDGTNISRYHGGSFEEMPIGNFYVVNTIWALAEDGSGNMWIGMGYHGLMKYDGVAFRRVADDPPGDDFTALLRDRYGNLWVGTIDYGLYYHVVE